MSSLLMKKILLVDDEALIAMSEAIALRKHGYTVEIASSGEQVLRMVRTDENIAIILMDIDLGSGPDGTEIAESILAEKDLPIIFLSSHSESEIVQKTESISSYGYVIKNSGIHILIASIKMAWRLFEANLKIKRQNHEIDTFNEELQITVEELEVSNEELREANVQRHLSEERWLDLFLQSQNAIAVYQAVEHGNDFVFIDFNPAAEKIENVKRNAIIGHKVTEIFPSVIDFGLMDVLRDVWITGQSKHHDITFYKDDRIEGWRENQVFKLKTGEIVALYWDITDQKKAEQALKENEEKFRSLVENSRDSIMLYDCGYRYLYMNPSAEFRISGFRNEDMIGKSDRELGFDPQLCELWEKVIQEVFKTGNAKSEIFSWESVKGNVYNELCLSPVYDVAGGIRSVLGVSRDITPMILAQQQLREAMDEKIALYAELEHRVKNSLAMIQSLLVLEENQHGDDSIKNVIKKIRTRLQTIIELYTLLRGKELDMKIPLKDYLESICHAVELSYKKPDQIIELHTTIEPITVEAKMATNIGLIVNELLTNAFKHAFNTVDSRGVIQVGARLNDAMLELTIEDNGVGFPEHYEYFSSKGLGAKLTNHLVEQMNGVFSFANLSKGVRINIKFPWSNDL